MKRAGYQIDVHQSSLTTYNQRQYLTNILFIIFMQKFKESEADVKIMRVNNIVSFTRSSAVAKRPMLRAVENFAVIQGHSRSFEPLSRPYASFY